MKTLLALGTAFPLPNYSCYSLLLGAESTPMWLEVLCQWKSQNHVQ